MYASKKHILKLIIEIKAIISELVSAVMTVLFKKIRSINNGGICRPSKGVPNVNDTAVNVFFADAAETLDWNAGLENCAGNEELYRNVLRLFLKEQPERLNVIGEAASMLDYETAIETAHTSKGIAATIGAARLCLLLTVIESDLRNNTLIRSVVWNEVIAEQSTVILLINNSL